jgi:hypothetical protein
VSNLARGSQPSYARVQLNGPPEAVARLVAALGDAGEIIFDLPSTEGDPRGDVTRTVRVATFPAPGPALSARRTAVVVRSGLSGDTVRRPGLDGLVGAELLEAGTAAALAAMGGVEAVRTRLVAMAYPPAPAS